MRRNLSALFATAVILSAGIVQGVWTDRWSQSPMLANAQAALDRVPSTHGAWTGKDIDVGQANMRSLGIVASLARRYVNARTGEAVRVLVVCGKPGPIVAHTPEICYTQSGYEISAATSSLALRPDPRAPAESLFHGEFRKRDSVVPVTLRIFWSWNATGTWEAREDPRVAFARHPGVYKLYLLREMSVADSAPEKDPCLDLFQRLAPELRRALAFGEPGPRGRAPEARGVR